MADDRYHRLDEEVAECLLRGRSAGEPPGTAARLAATLEELTSVRTTAGAVVGARSRGTGSAGSGDPDELPGEAAAVAAFREARAGAAPEGTGAAPRFRFRVRWTPGRPVRAGIAVALLGCMLGGVAVAAGTGVLPTPFGGASPSPSPVGTHPAVDGTESSGPVEHSHRHHHNHHRRHGDLAQNRTERGASGTAGAPVPGGGAAGRAVDPDTLLRDGVPQRDGGPRPGETETGVPMSAAALCEDRALGRLSEAERTELQRRAGGSNRVGDFCRRHGGGDGAGPRSGGDGAGPTRSGSPGATGVPDVPGATGVPNVLGGTGVPDGPGAGSPERVGPPAPKDLLDAELPEPRASGGTATARPGRTLPGRAPLPGATGATADLPGTGVTLSAPPAQY